MYRLIIKILACMADIGVFMAELVVECVRAPSRAMSSIVEDVEEYRAKKAEKEGGEKLRTRIQKWRDEGLL